MKSSSREDWERGRMGGNGHGFMNMNSPPAQGQAQGQNQGQGQDPTQGQSQDQDPTSQQQNQGQGQSQGQGGAQMPGSESQNSGMPVYHGFNPNGNEGGRGRSMLDPQAQLELESRMGMGMSMGMGMGMGMMGMNMPSRENGFRPGFPGADFAGAGGSGGPPASSVGGSDSGSGPGPASGQGQGQGQGSTGSAGGGGSDASSLFHHLQLRRQQEIDMFNQQNQSQSTHQNAHRSRNPQMLSNLQQMMGAGGAGAANGLPNAPGSLGSGNGFWPPGSGPGPESQMMQQNFPFPYGSRGMGGADGFGPSSSMGMNSMRMGMGMNYPKDFTNPMAMPMSMAMQLPNVGGVGMGGMGGAAVGPMGMTPYQYNDHIIQKDDINKHDVLCGRGGVSNTHVGNVSYREMVNRYKSKYRAATKKQKPLIAKEIVENIRNLKPSGRFLKKVKDHVGYEIIGDGEAVQKACQSLREGASKSRLSMEPDPPEFRDSSKSSMHSIDSGTTGNAAAIEEEKIETSDKIPQISLADKKLEAPTQTFETRFQQLERFKHEHGHLNITKDLDEKLYLYCRHIRQSRLNETISSEMIAKLDDLGFDWALKPSVILPSDQVDKEDANTETEKDGKIVSKTVGVSELKRKLNAEKEDAVVESKEPAAKKSKPTEDGLESDNNVDENNAEDGKESSSSHRDEGTKSKANDLIEL